MDDVFLGSEAIAAGRLTEHELRRRYRSIFHDVYVPRDRAPSLRARTTGAWLRTRGRGVVAGVAASALHGASWVDDDHVIEMISPSRRPQHGLIVRNETLADDESPGPAGFRLPPGCGPPSTSAVTYLAAKPSRGWTL